MALGGPNFEGSPPVSDAENRPTPPDVPGAPSPELQARAEGSPDPSPALQARAEGGMDRFLASWETDPDQHDQAPDAGATP